MKFNLEFKTIFYLINKAKWYGMIINWNKLTIMQNIF